MRALLAGCLALAAISLLLPSEPSYDPWAWIVWGREIAFLELDTQGGPSWKPGAVIFTLVFAWFGGLSDSIPPALWLIVARAGALLALAMAFRLAQRLAGPGRFTGIGAGVVALLALLLTPDWIRYMAHGNEVPLAVGLMLWAVERHLDGEHRHTAVLCFAASLLRPEIFAFLLPYSVWLFRAEPGARRLLGALALALPVLWLVPEWIGSGDPFDAGAQALTEPSWSLSRRDQPWLEALGRAHEIVGLPLELGALAAVAFAVRRRERATPALAAMAVLWVALIMVMTENGFSGNARYFLPAVVIVCVLAGVGAARLAGVVRHPAAVAGVAGLLTAASIPFLSDRLDNLDRQWAKVERLTRLHADLGDAVRAAGGPAKVPALGPPSVNRDFQTRLAWEAAIPMEDVELSQGNALVFKATGRQSGARARRSPGARRLGRVGAWEILGPPGERFAARSSPR